MKVLIVGLGALGSTSAELLCRAGNDLTLCDFDIVQEDNLPRQSLYTRADIGKLKVEAAAEHLKEIDPSCSPEVIAEPFSDKVSLDVDIIIDGTDSLQARMLLNDAAKKAGIPIIFGTASGTRGMVFGGCWQCVMKGKKATDDCSSGILGTTTHTIAALQVTSALRILNGEPFDELIEIDVWAGSMKRIKVKKHPQCRACKGQYVYLDSSFTFEFCASSGKMQARPIHPRIVNLENLDNVVKEYGAAKVVRLENGTALIHKHGMIEFDGVEESSARRFLEKMWPE